MNERIDLPSTLIEVAHYYYDENLSQQEIADRLNVSRSLIALYIKKAHDQGIVRIEIVDPKNNLDGISLRVQKKYELKKVAVVPGAHHSLALTRRALGSVAAHFVDEILQDGDIFGLGWGRTMMEMGSLMAPARPKQIDVIPLLGESGCTGSYTQLNQQVLQIARFYNATPYFLLAPILVGTSSLRDALLQDATALQVVKRWENLQVACVGIGSFPPAEGQVIYTGEENTAKLVQLDAVGDICARYFDSQGNFINAEQNDRMIGVSLFQLQKARHVVAVAGGAEKAIAVAGALRTHLITDLVIDESLAQLLI
ncbi:MAG: sugar-binding domain-containing protein [Anaerolineaceae bacterium]|nr:sugar-binding domain-containing protein [Anaerolineaceae bacterium]